MKKNRLAIRVAHDRGRTFGYYAFRPGEGLPYGLTFELSTMSPQARQAFVRGLLEMTLRDGSAARTSRS